MKRVKSPGFSGHVVDSIYASPDKVRKKVLALSFKAPDPSGLGGPAYRADIETSRELVAKLERIWGFDIEPVRTEIRYTLEGAKDRATLTSKNICHNDYHTSEYTAVVYLSRPVDCLGGTNFYRHIPSGAIEYHPTMGRIDYTNESDWEVTHTSDMVFNRLATYKSALFHGIKRPFFGDKLENARLIQTLRFNRK